MKRFKDYMKRTYKNKLVSVSMIIAGYLSTLIEGDGTAFVFMLMFAIPLFFVNDNCIG